MPLVLRLPHCFFSPPPRPRPMPDPVLILGLQRIAGGAVALRSMSYSSFARGHVALTCPHCPGVLLFWFMRPSKGIFSSLKFFVRSYEKLCQFFPHANVLLRHECVGKECAPFPLRHSPVLRILPARGDLDLRPRSGSLPLVPPSLPQKRFLPCFKTRSYLPNPLSTLVLCLRFTVVSTIRCFL